MSGESKQDRRRFLRSAAVTIAAAELGTIGFAYAHIQQRARRAKRRNEDEPS
jgi:hypothetical protein